MDKINRIKKVIVYIFAAIGFFLVLGYVAVQFGFTNTRGMIDTQHSYFQEEMKSKDIEWAKGDEYITFKSALMRDVEVIHRAARDSGSNPRIIVSQLIVEQLRLYHSDRELFKAAFAPLKILGNQSQFSWGVMGIKSDTAQEIEAHLTDAKSPYYLGQSFEHLLDFTTKNHDQERFERLTHESDRYYSYLYAGLYINQILTQWKNAGFDIHKNVGVVSTLYNLGFKNSRPNSDPKVGGSVITINGASYSFGGLASEFYNSEELLDAFPR